jgi:hypothetical protein
VVVTAQALSLASENRRCVAWGAVVAGDKRKA